MPLERGGWELAVDLEFTTLKAVELAVGVVGRAGYFYGVMLTHAHPLRACVQGHAACKGEWREDRNARALRLVSSRGVQTQRDLLFSKLGSYALRVGVRDGGTYPCSFLTR